MINEMDKDINFIDKTINLDKFHYLTDNVLDLAYFYNNENAIKLYNNIKSRKLYKFVNEIQEDRFDLDGFCEKINELKLNHIVIIDKIKLNYSMDEKNPLNFVELYENLEIVNKENLTFLFPQKFEEKIIKFYLKDRKMYNDVYKLIDLFRKK